MGTKHTSFMKDQEQKNKRNDISSTSVNTIIHMSRDIQVVQKTFQRVSNGSPFSLQVSRLYSGSILSNSDLNTSNLRCWDTITNICTSADEMFPLKKKSRGYDQEGIKQSPGKVEV